MEEPLSPTVGNAYFEDFSDFLLLLSLLLSFAEESDCFLSSFFESLESFDSFESLLELSPLLLLLPEVFDFLA